MTIDEAIAHAIEKAKEIRENIIYGNNLEPYESYCNAMIERCAEEHEQIAEWLEELKDYQDKNKMVVRVDVENMDSIKDRIDELSKYAESQYNKAIDDFAKWLVEHKIVDEDSMPEIIIDFNEEQLKVGGEYVD